MFVVLERFVSAHTLPVLLWELKLSFFNAWEVATHQFSGCVVWFSCYLSFMVCWKWVFIFKVPFPGLNRALISACEEQGALFHRSFPSRWGLITRCRDHKQTHMAAACKSSSGEITADPSWLHHFVFQLINNTFDHGDYLGANNSQSNVQESIHFPYLLNIFPSGIPVHALDYFYFYFGRVVAESKIFLRN